MWTAVALCAEASQCSVTPWLGPTAVTWHTCLLLKAILGMGTRARGVEHHTRRGHWSRVVVAKCNVNGAGCNQVREA